MKIRAKRELSDEELAKQKDGDNVSVRYREIGSEQQIDNSTFKLIDKVIYPINECPFCEGVATFHKRIQESGDVAGNVWRMQQVNSSNGFASMKFDYCLDCHKEFLIELYVFKKV